MLKDKVIKLNDEVISILKEGYIDNNLFFLPKVQLERGLYEQVNKALIAMGAKWNRKSQAHIFEYDIKDMLKQAIKTKEVIDWKKSTDFFHTPEKIIYEMIGLIQHYKYDKINFLEPSCRTRTHIRYCKKGISECKYNLCRKKSASL